jgi:hypothetical protein
MNDNRDMGIVKMEGISWGNASTLAANEGNSYWVIGHMIQENNPRHTGVFELKWGRHPRGENHPEFVDSKEGVTCISILVHGRMRLMFKRGTETQTVILQTEGDFVLWQPEVLTCPQFMVQAL